MSDFLFAAGMRLQAEAAVGSTLKIRLILRPWWSGVANALGGGRQVWRSHEWDVQL